MGYRVLIVDDSCVTRKIVKKTLSMIGLEIDSIAECQDGVEALAALEGAAVDILITDLNMPRMGGVELVRNLSPTLGERGMKVIVITSDRNEKRIEDLKSWGVCAVLNKPFRPEALREAIVGECHVR